MTVAGLAALAALFGIATALLRRAGEIAWLVGLAGYVLVLVGAWSLPLGVRSELGGEALLSTGYLRLFVMLLAATGGCLTVVGAAAGGSRLLPAIGLLWLAPATLALGLASAIPAVFLLSSGSLAAVLLAVEAGGPGPAMTAARGIRAIALAGVLAALAITWAIAAEAGRAAGVGDQGAPADPSAMGLAFLAAGAAATVRAGVIPVHAWAARLAERLPLLAVPTTFAWGPAALTVVLLTWVHPVIDSEGMPLPLERTLVTVVAVASIVFGAMAAYVHDDLEHIVSYSMVSDMGVVLLALAAGSPDAWGPVRLWILAFLAGRSALAGWAYAARSTFGTSRLPELRGWARRSPLLAGSLILITLTTLGLPGMPVFEARTALIDLALDPPFHLGAWLGVLATAGYPLLLGVVGFRSPTRKVAEAEHIMPGWPSAVGLDRSAPRRIVRSAWQANRAPVAAVAVLALSLVGLAIAAGGFHAPSVSAGHPPTANLESRVVTAGPIPPEPRAGPVILRG